MALFVCALFFKFFSYARATCIHIKGYKGTCREVIVSTRSGQASSGPFSPLLFMGMISSCVHNTQVSADEFSQRHDHRRPPSPTNSFNPTLVNDTRYTARPSLKLKIPGGVSNILNSKVVDAAGRSLYSISSDSKRTTLFSCRDNVEIATIQWDHHSPRMEFHDKKMKCKEWLKLTGPDNEYIPSPQFSP